MIALRILMTLIIFAVVGFMVWEQSHLGQMTREKWFIAVALVLGLSLLTWTRGLSPTRPPVSAESDAEVRQSLRSDGS